MDNSERTVLVQLIEPELAKYITPELKDALYYSGDNFFDLYPSYNYPGYKMYALFSDGRVYYFSEGVRKGWASLFEASSFYLDILHFAKHPGESITPGTIVADVREDLGVRAERLINQVSQNLKLGIIPESVRLQERGRWHAR